MISETLVFSVDTETLGIGDDALIIQLGVAAFCVDDPIGQMLHSFEFCVDHGKTYDNVEPYAAAMNWKILGYIAGYQHPEIQMTCDIVPVARAARVLGRYMREFMEASGTEDKPVLCGKQFSGFDRPKLERLPDWFAEVPKYHHRSPDPGSMYWRKEDGNTLPSTEVCMERAGIGGTVAHTAEQDAIVVATLIQTHYRSL